MVCSHVGSDTGKMPQIGDGGGEIVCLPLAGVALWGAEWQV